MIVPSIVLSQIDEIDLELWIGAYGVLGLTTLMSVVQSWVIAPIARKASIIPFYALAHQTPRNLTQVLHQMQ